MKTLISAFCASKRDFGKGKQRRIFRYGADFSEKSNFTAGFDGKFKLNSKTVMAFQVLGTHSRKFFYDADEDSNKYRTETVSGILEPGLHDRHARLVCRAFRAFEQLPR
jgi:hypothetical protein